MPLRKRLSSWLLQRTSISYISYLRGGRSLLPRRPLFDHLVGALAHDVGHRKPECSGGLHVERDLVFHRRLHRQVDRPLALEDSVDIAGGASIGLDLIGAVGDQAAFCDVSAERV